MSEEVQETEEVSEVEETEESPEENLSADDWKQIALKARKEAASRRLKAKETEAKLKEHDEWKKSQMSEVDRVKTEKSELELELMSFRNEKLQQVAAEKAKLDPQYADLITGKSEEEMVESAKRLKTRLGPASATTEGLRPGARGRPVGEENPKDAINDWFRSQFNK